MSIDFFTFFVQILNLLILLFLLRKFLYMPILKVLEERKSLLENEYKAAESARKKAQNLELKSSEKYAEIENEKQEILSQAHLKAQELTLKLTLEAQDEFKKNQKIWKNKLISEQNTFELALQRLIIEYFKKFSSQAFEQMADISLNELFINKIMQKISAQNKAKRSEFVRDFLTNKEIELISADELNTKTKHNFKSFLQDEFLIGDDFKIKYKTDKNLICGIIIKAKEQMIEWNLAEYLAEFSDNLNKAVSSLINKD